MLIRYLPYIFIFVFSSSAASENVWCSGKIYGSYIATSGDLLISGSWRGDWTRICNVNGTWEGIDTVLCSLWASYAATALKDQLGVVIQYTVPSGTTCATIGTYGAAPKPQYLMITKP